MTLGVVTFLSSCKKEKTCTCTETDLDSGYSATETVNPEDYNIGSCSALEDYFIMNSNGFDYKCN